MLCIATIANGDTLNFATIDTLPICKDKALPDYYTDALQKLQALYVLPRTVPVWTLPSSSPLCTSIRRLSDKESVDFVKYSCSVVRMHLEAARTMNSSVFSSRNFSAEL